MPEDYFGDDVAARYDDSSSPMFDPEVLGPTVDLLAGLAGDGAALEFAVGTGRVALPLAARGVPVSGIELSTAMAERLRAKDDAQRVKVTIGDMATTRVDGCFRLVYLVFNTIGNLTTQDQQVACFANAAAHLEPGGYFVIEVGVPDLRRLPPGEDARVFSHAPGYVGYDRYIDLVAQQAPLRRRRVRRARAQDALPVCVAVRARPDGETRRHVAQSPVGRLEPLALHRREHLARLRLAEDGPPEAVRTANQLAVPEAPSRA